MNFMPDGESGFSIAVYFNQFFSEMWDHPDFPDSDSYLAYLDEVYEDCITCTGGGYIFDEFAQIWPTYDEPLHDQWAETDVPMLILQGQLDPATHYPQSLGARDHFTGEHQYFLDFPDGSHGIVFGTPTSYSMFGRDCGVDLLRAFLRDPRADLDLSCMDEVVPLTFDGTDDAPRYMDRPDWWDNP